MAALESSKKDAGKAVPNLMMYFLPYVSCAVSTLLDLTALLSQRPDQANVSPASLVSGHEIWLLLLWLLNVANVSSALFYCISGMAGKTLLNLFKVSCHFLVLSDFSLVQSVNFPTM